MKELILVFILGVIKKRKQINYTILYPKQRLYLEIRNFSTSFFLSLVIMDNLKFLTLETKTCFFMTLAQRMKCQQKLTLLKAQPIQRLIRIWFLNILTYGCHQTKDHIDSNEDHDQIIQTNNLTHIAENIDQGNVGHLDLPKCQYTCKVFGIMNHLHNFVTLCIATLQLIHIK